MMYHGTTMENARKIMCSGFRVGSVGSSGGESSLMLGPGIYASPDMGKAQPYARAAKGEPGVILELEVDMGIYICRVTSQGQWNRTTWQQQGYHSAFVPANCGMVKSGRTEVCVKYPGLV